MSNLQSGFILQGGKYRIEKALGQGGFGITYLAEQTLMEREVCIKEFFMKEYCDRDEATSQVSLGTTNNKAMMEKYQEKFLKEARLIARLDHPNIIRIHDVFTENNTAYYVMDYIEGKNLNDIVKERGALPESEALGYIIPICEGLEYVHSHKINHLDIKPGNILVRKSDNRPILIDFGMSKQYDESGDQTSSTPLGISAGYAPLELYQAGGVSSFSPQTDIYELGATVYRLVTGKVPPSATDVANDGLPEMSASISTTTKTAIEKAMEFRKKDRPSQVKEFLSMLQDRTHDERDSSPVAEKKMENTEANTVTTSDKSDQTVLVDIPESKELQIEDTLYRKKETPSQSVENDKGEKGKKVPIATHNPSLSKTPEPNANIQQSKKWLWGILACAAVVAVIAIIILGGQKNDPSMSNSSAPNTGIDNGHEWVDLGLSVNWATCNVGASSPSEYGSYFAWAETEEKSEYSWETLRYCNNYPTRDNSLSPKTTFTKYYLTDARPQLDFNDDAATVNWGGNWRMPTEAEMSELIHNCKWSWIQQAGIYGYKVQSKVNGSSIFLPAAESRSFLPDDWDDGEGNYWTSSSSTRDPADAKYLFFYKGSVSIVDGGRCPGYSVRPVTDSISDPFAP